MREWDYDRYLKRVYAIDPYAFDRDIFEAEDVPSGDYTTRLADVLAVHESRSVHHRRPRSRESLRAFENYIRMRLTSGWLDLPVAAARVRCAVVRGESVAPAF
jgi:hypothetical protein